MAGSISQLDAQARRLPDVVIFAVALGLVAALAVMKATIGRDVPIVDFFLIPVAVAGWLARSPRYACVTAVITAVVSVVVTVRWGGSPVGATMVSGAARLSLYLIMLAFLRAMRGMQLDRESEARVDAQTGAVNKRAFREIAQRELQRARRSGAQLSLAYLDIDDFKAINDRLGHVEGDNVLLRACHVMRTSVRAADVVARLGGDEFAILMPATSAAAARIAVKRLDTELGRLVASDGGAVTWSIGLVTFNRAPVSLLEVVEAGDDLMYTAKRAGKDRVEQRELAGPATAAFTSLHGVAG